MRKRIFDIIQIGNKEDAPSRIFDYTIVGVILLNILSLFMQTFEELSFMSTALSAIEYGTTFVFLIEYILRILTADYLYPEKTRGKAILHFLISFDGIVDLLTILSVLPVYWIAGFVAFRIIRIIRIFHLFRINSQYDSFQVILAVLKDKWRQILSALVIIVILMMGSSLAMYSIEHEAQPEAFANAFSGIWWSVSCLLTVGYGDIYPITVAGQILAILIAFLGVGVVAIPTGIISAGFVEQYNNSQNAEKQLKDMPSVHEVVLTEGHEYIGRTVGKIMETRRQKILVVLRNNLTVLATDELVLEKDDVILTQKIYK